MIRHVDNRRSPPDTGLLLGIDYHENGDIERSVLVKPIISDGDRYEPSASVGGKSASNLVVT